LLLPCNGAAHVTKIFEIHQTMDGVTAGVGSGDFFPMVRGPALQVVGHADVEIARAAGEDLNAEMIFAGWHDARACSRNRVTTLRTGKADSLAGMTERKAEAKAKADSLTGMTERTTKAISLRGSASIVSINGHGRAIDQARILARQEQDDASNRSRLGPLRKIGLRHRLAIRLGVDDAGEN
jgi:hypothetical protein